MAKFKLNLYDSKMETYSFLRDVRIGDFVELVLFGNSALKPEQVIEHSDHIGYVSQVGMDDAREPAKQSLDLFVGLTLTHPSHFTRRAHIANLGTARDQSLVLCVKDIEAYRVSSSSSGGFKRSVTKGSD
jgi:hypothetical protein